MIIYTSLLCSVYFFNLFLLIASVPEDIHKGGLQTLYDDVISAADDIYQ